jgi:hypothetical protein
MAINEKQPGDYGYVAFFERQRAEIYAPSLYAAKVRALEHFKPSKKRAHMVSVTLAERADGSDVVHVATE